MVGRAHRWRSWDAWRLWRLWRTWSTWRWLRGLRVLKALDRKLLRDLRALWSQALTLALVVGAAVAGFITTYSAYDSLDWSRQRYYESANFADVFADLRRAPDTIATRLRALPGVAQVETSITQQVQIAIPGVDDPIIGRLNGIDWRRLPQVNRLYLRSGRMIAGRSGHQLEALVSEAFAIARQLRPGDSVNALMNGKRESLLIVGIALTPDTIFAGATGAPDLKGYGVFWVDQQALGSAYDMQGAFNHVAARIAPHADEAQVIAGLDRVLRPWGGLSAYGRSEQMSHMMLSAEIREQKVMGTVLPGIFLAIAAFLLNVVLGRQISVQREQIAALKALGYDNAAIASHYLKFALLVVAIGALIGLLAGSWLGSKMMLLYETAFRFPALLHRVRPELMLLAIAVTGTAALLATWQAIRDTVKLAPAEAMGPRAPGRYRPSFIETLGAGRWLAPSSRMILRNMQRHGFRTAVTVAGVAAAIAVLVCGTFWGDSIDLLLDTQFRLALRGDVTVGLVEPRAVRVRHEFEALPLVSAVEGTRSVRARLVHGNHAWRGVLQGRPALGDLRRIVTMDRRSMAPPADALLLTDRLASKLDLKVGDLVRVEVEEGERPVLMLPVAGTVSEMMGLSAYIERRSLNRLLQEGDVVNELTLAIDRGGETELLQRLRALPLVAAAFSKAALLRNVQSVTARNIRIISSVLTVFATIIAAGVVYNQVRIALTERAWELASLRVLGFTRHEVSRLLLGELAIAIALAIPLGMAAGYGLAHGVIAMIRNDEFVFPVVIRAPTYAYAVMCVVVAGIVSALVVNRKIAALDLVGVLKTRE